MNFDNFSNPFYILKVSPHADDEEVRKAYIKAVRRFPPDRNREEFLLIQNAFKQIKNRRDRIKRYLFTLKKVDSLCEAVPDFPNKRNILNEKEWMKIIRKKK